MQCSVKTCERKVLARGWCSMHYQSWRAWGHPEGSAPAKIPSRCEREGCPRPASAKGLCSMHYAQLRRSRTTCSEEGCTKGLQAKGLCAMHYRRQRMAGTTCAVEDCVKVCQAGGLCSAHYKRKMKHGDPLLGGRVLVNDGPCSEEGCEKTAAKRGLCEGHHKRLYKYGSASAGGTETGAAQSFFRDVVVPHAGADCLLWPYARNRGYGVMGRLGGGTLIVSREACTVVHGPPPTPQHEAAHLCGKGSSGCVNPHHLCWATPEENELHKFQHGTTNRGETNGQARLTEAEVHEIRRLGSRMSQRQLAARFEIAASQISQILARKAWGWLSDDPEEEPPATKPKIPYLQDVPLEVADG